MFIRKQQNELSDEIVRRKGWKQTFEHFFQTFSKNVSKLSIPKVQKCKSFEQSSSTTFLITSWRLWNMKSYNINKEIEPRATVKSFRKVKARKHPWLAFDFITRDILERWTLFYVSVLFCWFVIFYACLNLNENSKLMWYERCQGCCYQKQLRGGRVGQRFKSKYLSKEENQPKHFMTKSQPQQDWKC